jgi:hypothetical protein
MLCKTQIVKHFAAAAFLFNSSDLANSWLPCPEMKSGCTVTLVMLKNVGLDTKIMALGGLQQILRHYSHSMAAIVKIQDGRHIWDKFHVHHHTGHAQKHGFRHQDHGSRWTRIDFTTLFPFHGGHFENSRWPPYLRQISCTPSHWPCSKTWL